GSTGTGASTTHTYSLVGSYAVTLTVVDSGSPQQTTTSQRTISVANPPPLSAGLTFSPASPDAGQSVSFTASASGGTPPYSYSCSPSSPLPLERVTFTATGSGGAQPYSYSWDFGDGTTASGQTVSLPYLLPGSYVVTLTITDASGQTLTTSQTVIVLTHIV